jgi:prefoldin beta subunit
MSAMSQLPPQVQERLQRLQQLQNTMQQLVMQRQRIEMEIADSNRALDALSKMEEGAKSYMSMGAVLVEKPKDEIIKELTDRKEFLDMRIKVIQKQEDKTKEKLSSLQETLQKELGISQ